MSPLDTMSFQHLSLRGLLDEHLEVRLIAEPLRVFDAEDDASEAARSLDADGFDECGVRVQGRVTHLARREALESGTVGRTATAIPLDRLISARAPLWRSFPGIVQHRSVFLLGRGEVDRVVGIADLAKQPARLMMFGIISTLEMLMLELIRQRDDKDAALDRLPPDRAEKAALLFEDRRRGGCELDVLDCLHFCDKATICTSMPDLLEHWGLGRGGADRLFGSLNRIRNDLAHSNPLDADRPLEKVVARLEEARRLIDRTLAIPEGAASGSVRFSGA